MSRYAKINKNDIVNGKGVSVSFWSQGCPHRCEGCHNKETWDFTGGKEFTQDTIDEVLQAIGLNGIERNLSIQQRCRNNGKCIAENVLLYA
mgnify:CR=1 FL=1